MESLYFRKEEERMPETTWNLEQRGRFPAVIVLLVDLILVGAFAILSVRSRAVFSSDALAFGLFPAAGALIIYRQPRNPVGWLAAALGALFILNEVLFNYALDALITHPGSLPFGGLVSWISTWTWTLNYVVAIPLILLLPNGRPLSPRWAILIRSVTVCTLPVTLLIMVLLWPLRGLPLIQNDGDISTIIPTGRFVFQVITYWQPVIILHIALASLALILRFVRARGIERLQLKWIALAIVLVPINLAFDNIAGSWTNPVAERVREALNLLSIIGFPIAIAIATTRYRLYDIDVIIRRTLVYTLLTGVLGLIYFADVIALQRVFSALTGQQSPVAVVLSTLLIAILARTLHNRIQTIIDRRFYRQRYNADQALEQFSARLRSNLDLEQVEEQVSKAVDLTLQPEFTILWLAKTKR